MVLPELTHLQFFAVGLVRERERRGAEIREELERQLGVKTTLAAFYQLMRRLEQSGLVKGRYDVQVIGGQVVKERIYQATFKGVRSVRAVREFYRECAAA